MIIICHRGLMNGPNKTIENHPDQINKAINAGFDVEIDIRYIDGKFVLGHDQPQYEINKETLDNYRYWIHCKNIEALYELQDCKYSNIFYHNTDDCVLTSKKYIWTFPNTSNILTDKSIACLPEKVNYEWEGIDKCYGVCTDFAFRYSV